MKKEQKIEQEEREKEQYKKLKAKYENNKS